MGPGFLPPPRSGPRLPLWGTALVAVAATGAGLLIYHAVSSQPSPHLAGSPAAAASKPATTRPPASPTVAASPTATPTSSQAPGTVLISLAAVTEPCWAQLTTAAGATVYQGILAVGSTMTWTESQAVMLQLGNPGGVTLTVNGQARTGLGVNPVTLNLAPVQ